MYVGAFCHLLNKQILYYIVSNLLNRTPKQPTQIYIPKNDHSPDTLQPQYSLCDVTHGNCQYL